MKRTILITGMAFILSAGILAKVLIRHRSRPEQETNKGYFPDRNTEPEQTRTHAQQVQVQNTVQMNTQTQNGTQTKQQAGDQLKTQKRDQLKLHNQAGTGDKIQKKDRLRVHDKTQLKTQDQTHKTSMAKAGNNSQMRAASRNAASGVNASRQGAMRMNGGIKGGRR